VQCEKREAKKGERGLVSGARCLQIISLAFFRTVHLLTERLQIPVTAGQSNDLKKPPFRLLLAIIQPDVTGTAERGAAQKSCDQQRFRSSYHVFAGFLFQQISTSKFSYLVFLCFVY